MADKTIHQAAGEGDLDTVRNLLEADATLADADDVHQWRPLFHAGLWRHLDVVECLLDFGADAAAHDGYALHYAAEMPDNKAVVRALILSGGLDAFARPATDEQRQFLSAVFLANASRVEHMLARSPALARQQDGTGHLAAHRAAQHGDTDILRLLLDAGADANALTASGQTMLYCAAGHRHKDATRLLLERGADRDARLADGKTIIEWLEQFSEDQGFQAMKDLIQAHAPEA